MKKNHAVMIALLYAFALTIAGVRAAESTLESGLADIGNRAGYFHYEGRGGKFAVARTAAIEIQGVVVDVPVPEGLEISKAEMENILFFNFKQDGVSILQCSFRPEVEKTDGEGDPLAAKRLELQKMVEENLAIRESAENLEDAERPAATPVIVLAQNTAASVILEARDAGGERWGTPSLFEGYVVLGDLCVPVAANGQAVPSGIDTGDLYMFWLNGLLGESGE